MEMSSPVEFIRGQYNMYIINLINPHKQFGKFNYSMIFHDTSGEIPDNRWEKKYPDDIKKTALLTDLKQTIKAFAIEQGITWEDAKTNGASVSIDVKGGTKTLWTI